MQKPNALLHMTLWGLISGLVSGFVIPLMMASFGIDYAWDSLLIMALIYGAVPGLILGGISGGIIHYLLRDVDNESFEKQAQRSRKWVAALVFFGTTLFMMLAFSPKIFGDVVPSTVIPIVAAIIAAIATESYLGRVEKKKKGDST